MGDVRGRYAVLLFVALMLTIASPASHTAGQQSSCCNSEDFELFLLGEADIGTLSPFDSDLDEAESALVTQVFQPIEVGKWGVTWGSEGDHPDSTWEFTIPYEVQGAVGVNINATLEVRIGGSFYQGSSEGLNPYITGDGDLQILVDVEAGQVNDGDLVEITLNVQLLGFNQPGDNAGVTFLWGSEDKKSSISVRLPLVEIQMRDASVSGTLVYFPILLSSGFDDRMWSASVGGISVQNSAVSEKPVATLVENGVEVTFVWNIPDGTEGGTYRVDFHLEPQEGLVIEANMTHSITVGEDGGGSGTWYPANEPLRTGGTDLSVNINAEWKGDSTERHVTLEFEGAMSQWMRWGLDNIGNTSLESNSWWRNLKSYSSSIPQSDYNNGMVDDSELVALTGYLTGSTSDMRSFLSNGIFIEAESVLGIDPIDLGPTEININMGGTRGFSSDSISITISTSYLIYEGERQLLVENFIRPSLEEYWTTIGLHVELKGSMLQDVGVVSSEGIEYSHRRWIVQETISIDEDELDLELDFRVEFTPTGNPMFSVLVGSGIMVLALCAAIGTGLNMTRKRSRFPTMVTVATMGLMSFAIYFLGLPMQMVLGVVLSSILLVFPISLLSPKVERAENNGKVGGRVNCPSCGNPISVDSDVRPLRLSCSECGSIIRIE